MAPNKFEKHIKKQLQEREIKPSANAWETLSEKLDAVAPQMEKKSYFWYGIAASIIGLLILSIVYFNSGFPANNPGVQVVDADEEVIEARKKVELEDDKDIEKEVVVENDKKELDSSQPVQTIIGTETVELSNQLASINEDDSVIKSSVKKVEKLSGFKEEIINNKILEIVAAVDSLEENTDALTEAEVDDLLRNAQNEILLGKLFDQQGSVDAMALLTEVEVELDKSFRDQIFESLKTGFLKVRTAVADRNK